MNNEACEKWLYMALAGKKSVPINIIRGEALKRGFTKRELKAARRSLGVRLYTGDDGYYWYLEG